LDFACFAFAVALFGLAAVHAHRRGELFPVPAAPPRARRPTLLAVVREGPATAEPPPAPTHRRSNVVDLGARAAVAGRRR